MSDVYENYVVDVAKDVFFRYEFDNINSFELLSEYGVDEGSREYDVMSCFVNELHCCILNHRKDLLNFKKRHYILVGVPLILICNFVGLGVSYYLESKGLVSMVESFGGAFAGVFTYFKFKPFGYDKKVNEINDEVKVKFFSLEKKIVQELNSL